MQDTLERLHDRIEMYEGGLPGSRPADEAVFLKSRVKVMRSAHANELPSESLYRKDAHKQSRSVLGH
jgi:hypothetical protein